jgi:hypothetical protein
VGATSLASHAQTYSFHVRQNNVANPNKIEVNDLVTVIDGRGNSSPGKVLALPDNQSDYWIIRGPIPNLDLFYVSKYAVPIIQLVAKA